MPETIRISVHAPDILVATYEAGGHPIDLSGGIRERYAQIADIPEQFALVTDLSQIIDQLDFEDLMDIARFWAAERRRITRHAAVVRIPEDWKPAIEAMNLYTSVLQSEARIGLFESIGEAVRWIQQADIGQRSSPRTGSSDLS